jgi:prepilin-type N-terminal cleavage/methylation domain-containing protein
MIRTVRTDRVLQPQPRTRTPDRRAGFTLIEVVAVMLIIALVASLAVAMMPGRSKPPRCFGASVSVQF